MVRVRLATFNLESLDDTPQGVALGDRVAALRPLLLRLDADILCLQEVNGQEAPQGRTLRALDALIDETPYARFGRVVTAGAHGPSDRHNLVVLARFPMEHRQVRHDLVAGPAYRMVTARPPATEAAAIAWDRPVQHVSLTIGRRRLDLVNLHLRAPLAAPVPGQKLSPFVWRSVGAWAEGYYLAAMKRAGQALEVRLLIEQLFAADLDALIAVAGDFNADLAGTPLRILVGDPADTGNPALAAHRLHPVEDALPVERRYSVIHDGHRWLVDHILASPALRARHERTALLNEALRDEVREADAAYPGSFHAPMVAEFVIDDRP